MLATQRGCRITERMSSALRERVLLFMAMGEVL
jgi:hypothetical protein